MNKVKPTELKEVQVTEAKTPIQEINIESLISQAITNNISVDVMERLLTIRRELKAERAKEEYDRAMAAFQSDCPTIEKTKAVPTKSGAIAYKYAPIESIVSQVKEQLKNNGFSYSTNMELLPTGVKVSVKVTHSAGHSEITDMSVPLGTQTGIMSQTQVVAAAQTFAKRYAFCNAFGILTGDEDTDAAPPTEDNKPQFAKKQTYNQPSESKSANIHIPSNGMTRIALTQCNSCHAPAGKPHASKCTTADEAPIDVDEVEKGILKQKEMPVFNNK